MEFLNKISSYFNKIDESNYVSFSGLKSEQQKWEAYFYPSTYNKSIDYGVLKNLKGIKNTKELNHFEKVRSATNIIKLNKLNKSFNIEHYRNIHKTLFSDIYSWAGEFRQVDMKKGNSNLMVTRNIRF